ncbi:MAG: helix-turn-helix transcriptional regulator, partial [Pyramidobacter sp.]|nr:helix-turn-helix transcriptional regulator [Pyramidobacter sp.]
SQSQLARLSGVSLRSIQTYEQRINDIDKAQAQAVCRLSRALGCRVEDVLEDPLSPHGDRDSLPAYL